MAEIIEIVEITGGDEIIEVGDIILTAGYDVTDATMVNVTNYVPLGAGEYYTLTTAIAAVPGDMRKTGLCITFATSSGVWKSYQFKGASTSGWATEADWELQGVSQSAVDGKEPLLPATPDNPDIKYLNGLREWAPIAVGAGGYAAPLYFTNIDSDISGYKKISNTADVSATELSATVTQADGEKFFRAYAFDAAIATTVIDAGPWVSVFKVKVSNATGVTQLVLKAYARHTDNSETLLFSANSTEINNTSYEVIPNQIPQSLFTVLATDRLVLKIYGKTTSGSTITITTFIGDGDASYITTPLAPRHDQLRDKNGNADYLHVTKVAQTFDGVKTFTDSPVVPNLISGSADGAVVNKKTMTDADALKIDKVNIANNLTTTAEGYTLDARQGKALNDAIALKENAANKKTIINDSDTEFPTSKAIRTQVISLLLPRDYSNNRATNKRYHSQLSPLFTQVDNIEEVSEDLMSTCRPCIIDRNAAVVAYLDKNDVTKLESGSAADLTLWNNPVVLQYGGFYSKYEHDLVTNEKIKKISLVPIKGYTYHKRRFRGLYDGTVVTNSADGTSKSFLTSNSGVYSTHSVSLQNFHAYAKNLGPSFRAMSWQDHEILTWLFWLIEGTTNSQAVYRGIVDVNGTNWAAYNKSADGGQPTYGQFHLNGITNDIVGHKGEKTITISDFPNGAITVKPHKWNHIENFIAGPYSLLATGRLLSNDNFYEFKDLSKIAFTVNLDASLLCSINGIKPAVSGWQRILETYRDTLIPEAIGGSDTTGYCDQWYGLAAMGTGPYVPMLRGDARYGSFAGLGFLFSGSGPAAATAYIGAVLACDDPSDPIPDGWVVE